MEWEKKMLIERITELLPEATLCTLECIYYFVLKV